MHDWKHVLVVHDWKHARDGELQDGSIAQGEASEPPKADQAHLCYRLSLDFIQE